MLRHRIALIAVVAVAVTLPMLADAQGRRAGGAGRPGSTEVSTDAVQRDSAGNVVFQREVYNYPRAGRRDPFTSLIESGEIRPMLADLQVVAITTGANARNSIATIRDKSSNEIYRVRVGTVFGRIRVTAIRSRDVMVEIDEFGYKRQDSLSINVPVGGGRRP